MWPWIERILGALPMQVRGQVLPVLMKAGVQLLPLWQQLKARGEQLGSVAAAAPEVLEPAVRALSKKLKEDPDAILQIVSPLWDVVQRVLAHPSVREHLQHLAVNSLDIASEQLERALAWVDSPDSTRRLGEGLTALERFVEGWLERASRASDESRGGAQHASQDTSTGVAAAPTAAPTAAPPGAETTRAGEGEG